MLRRGRRRELEEELLIFLLSSDAPHKN